MSTTERWKIDRSSFCKTSSHKKISEVEKWAKNYEEVSEMIFLLQFSRIFIKVFSVAVLRSSPWSVYSGAIPLFHLTHRPPFLSLSLLIVLLRKFTFVLLQKGKFFSTRIALVLSSCSTCLLSSTALQWRIFLWELFSFLTLDASIHKGRKQTFIFVKKNALTIYLSKGGHF